MFGIPNQIDPEDDENRKKLLRQTG
jgi:hypothetical protein